MRGEIKFLRGLGVSAVALLLIVGGVTAANSGGTQSRVEPAGTAEATVRSNMLRGLETLRSYLTPRLR